ncbi:hypothetical protein BH24BAC1_BH24BAC1_00200 [soil metagenome]
MKNLLFYYFIKKGLVVPTFLVVSLASWFAPFSNSHEETISAEMAKNMAPDSLMHSVLALMRQDKRGEALALAQTVQQRYSSRSAKEFIRAYGLLQSPDSLLWTLHQDKLVAIQNNRFSGKISGDTLLNRLIIASIRNNTEALEEAISQKKSEARIKQLAEDKQRRANELEIMNEANMYVRSVYRD